MFFLNSVLFGSEGSYNILGIQANFKKEEEKPWWCPFISRPNVLGAGIIATVANECRSINLFRFITQGYAHVFVHEMSHALAFKLMTNQDTSIQVFTSTCTGSASLPTETLPDWKKTIVSAAGPMGDIAFCTCKLVAATALKSYLSWPIALALGSGSVIWMSGELLYACTSALKKNGGDFGKIASTGNAHLTLASTALASQCALGIFAAVKLAA